jgi:cysteinyl-tRNA synthetase
MLVALGLDPVTQWPAAAADDLTGTIDALVRLALEARADARTRKDFAAADAVRDQLDAAGIVVEDTAEGPRWRLRGEL